MEGGYKGVGTFRSRLKKPRAVMHEVLLKSLN